MTEPDGAPPAPAETAVPSAPEAPASAPIFELWELIDEADESLYVDFQVPRLLQEVFVRYGPVDQPRVEEIASKSEKSKDKNKTVLAHAKILAEACRGVWRPGPDGKPVGIDGSTDPDEWPRFDDRLAQALRLTGTPTAVDIICGEKRSLYRTGQDVIATGIKYQEWLGLNLEAITEAERGN